MEGIENIDYVVCKICGRKARMLTQHIKIKHNISRREYEEKYKSPAICQARKDIQKNRNRDLNYKLSTDPYYIELMKVTRHNNGCLPQVQKALQDGHIKYATSETGRAKNSARMLEKWKDEDYRHSQLSSICSRTYKHYEDYNGDTVALRSKWELDLYNYLKMNNIDFNYEGVKISYITEDGSNHSYIPDFIINDNIILEVKPSNFINNKVNKIKRQAAISAGYIHYYITEKELRDLNSFFHNVIGT